MSNILLSICIPTFNRPLFLKRTIESIISQEIFLYENKIEIIISDNSSNNETLNMIQYFRILHPNKIFYYKNEINIGDENISRALSLGNGSFLKLNNDTLTFNSNSLNEILNTIQENIYLKPNLFFLNNMFKHRKKIYQINNLNNFLLITKYASTWIGTFGIWKKDFNNNFFNIHNKLPQFEVTLKMVTENKNTIIINSELFKTQAGIYQGGYDLVQIFYINFNNILNSYLFLNKINKKTIIYLNNYILFHFFSKWALRVNLEKKYYFKNNNIIKDIIKIKKNQPFILLIFLLKYYITYFPYKLYQNLKYKN